jgi:GTP1/Obg family GTP-binding protein
MNTLYVELEAAMECELVVKVLDILVDIAALHADNGETTSAAEILALVMEYPVRAVTLERAVDLFDMLERQVCPRVISDARDLAQEMTLDDLVARLLSPANRI